MAQCAAPTTSVAILNKAKTFPSFPPDHFDAICEGNDILHGPPNIRKSMMPEYVTEYNSKRNSDPTVISVQTNYNLSLIKVVDSNTDNFKK